MRREVYALVLPLIVIPCVLLGIALIGNILLLVGDTLAVPVALGFSFVVIFGCMYAASRGRDRTEAH